MEDGAIERSCKKCAHEFKVIAWLDGSCPSCNAEYGWDMDYDGDYNGFPVVVWY